MSGDDRFQRQLDADRRTERALVWRELLVLAVVIAVVVARLHFGD